MKTKFFLVVIQDSGVQQVPIGAGPPRSQVACGPCCGTGRSLILEDEFCQDCGGKGHRLVDFVPHFSI